jgi:hypothetical protein
MLDPNFLGTLVDPYPTSDYTPTQTWYASTTIDPRNIDVSIGGPYADYNWELLYYIPVMIAVHLSNNRPAFGPPASDQVSVNPQRVGLLSRPAFIKCPDRPGCPDRPVDTLTILPDTIKLCWRRHLGQRKLKSEIRNHGGNHGFQWIRPEAVPETRWSWFGSRRSWFGRRLGMVGERPVSRVGS